MLLSRPNSTLSLHLGLWLGLVIGLGATSIIGVGLLSTVNYEAESKRARVVYKKGQEEKVGGVLVGVERGEEIKGGRGNGREVEQEEIELGRALTARVVNGSKGGRSSRGMKEEQLFEGEKQEQEPEVMIV